MPSVTRAQRAYRLVPVCLFLCLLQPFAAAAGQVNSADLANLLKSAAVKRLDAAPLWRALLHVPAGTDTSLIDDPKFFIADDGKMSPASELRATLTALYSSAAHNDEHPICRYPARIEWLTDELALDTAQLPQPECKELTTFLNTVQPRSASIMFPAAYMNSPASMFGHTYLRIDGAYTSDLLGYAANYSAQTDESNGFLYALNGIFGRYKGFYSILPHFAKVREYSGIEHRDIWEYRLNLNSAEVRKMTLHLWELRERYSDYYFFDENCSYNVLFLLAAGRPSTKLTAKSTPWVIPLDTIDSMRSAGLIESTRYRPSQGRRIRAIADGLSGSAIDQALALSTPSAKPLIPAASASARTAAVLDLATELLQYNYGKNRINQTEYKDRLLALLNERSAMGADLDKSGTSQPDAPDQGHASSRISLAGGTSRGDTFAEIGIRPAYHALTDPGIGFQSGAHIQFMNTRLRYYPRREDVRLERLDLVDIISLADYERIFRQISWKIRAGVEQLQNRNGEDVLAFRINTGGGLSQQVGQFGLLYAMAEFDGNLGQGLYEWYATGIGASVGIQSDPARRVMLNLKGSTIWYPLGDKRTVTTTQAAITLRMNRNNSLETQLLNSISDRHNKQEITVGWNCYF